MTIEDTNVAFVILYFLLIHGVQDMLKQFMKENIDVIYVNLYYLTKSPWKNIFL